MGIQIYGYLLEPAEAEELCRKGFPLKTERSGHFLGVLISSFDENELFLSGFLDESPPPLPPGVKEAVDREVHEAGLLLKKSLKPGYCLLI
jgi:hypothetical protein